MVITKLVKVGNGLYLCVPKITQRQITFKRNDRWLITAPTRTTLLYNLLTPRILKRLQKNEARIAQTPTA